MKKTILIIAILILGLGTGIYITISKNKNVDTSINEAQESMIPMERHEIELTEDQIKLIGLKTYTLKPVRLKKTIKTYGNIQFDETLLQTVNTRFEGWIEKLYVNYTGRYVKKGEPLFEIYSPEVFSTIREYLIIKESIKKAENEKNEKLIHDLRILEEASKERLRLWDISEKEISDIENNRKPLRSITIYSPVEGYVINKYIIEGMKVMQGEKIFDIAPLSRVWLIAEIYESDIELIKTGMNALVSLSYLHGRVFKTTIDYIYPVVSPETRTIKVRIPIDNKDDLLKPDMYTKIDISIHGGTRLAIPEDAVIDTGNTQVVYVLKENEVFEAREIMLGQSFDGMRVVIKGLREGDKIVSDATFLLDSEAKLKGIKPLPLR